MPEEDDPGHREQLAAACTYQKWFRRTTTVWAAGKRNTAIVAPIRVLLAVCSSCLLQAYKRLINNDEELDVVAEATDVTTAVLEVMRAEPHVAILDFHLQDGGGLQAAERIKLHCPATEVILLSDYELDEYKQAAREAGAACVTKTAFASLVHTIKSLSTATKEAGR